MSGVTPIGCVIYGRAWAPSIYGRDCGCADARVHRPFNFVVGDTWEITAALSYGDGTPFNLGAGCAITWRLLDADGNTVILMSLGAGIDVLDAVAGTCLVTVPPSISATIPVGNYTDALQATDPTGFVSTQSIGAVNALPSFFV